MALTSSNKFSSKDPLETVILTFDFSGLLNMDAQEVLNGATWSASIVSVGANMLSNGLVTPDDSATLLSGVTSVLPYASSHAITAGTSGNIYELSCLATTSLGQTFRVVGQLPVITVV